MTSPDHFQCASIISSQQPVHIGHRATESGQLCELEKKSVCLEAPRLQVRFRLEKQFRKCFSQGWATTILLNTPLSANIFIPDFAGVAQLVERELPKLEVAGPSPVARFSETINVDNTGTHKHSVNMVTESGHCVARPDC